MKSIMKKEFQCAEKLIMFGFNFPHNFIEKVWHEDKLLTKHLRNKFNAIYESKGSGTVFFLFYTELDNGNRKKLLEWIEINYKG